MTPSLLQMLNGWVWLLWPLPPLQLEFAADVLAGVTTQWPQPLQHWRLPQRSCAKIISSSPFFIREVTLTVRIFDGRTEVASRMLLEKNTGGSLPLDGEDLKLKKVLLSGKELK